MSPEPRFVPTSEREKPRPLYVVWEITLACNLACGHCGSRAGPVRAGELSTEDCLRLVDQLAQMGTEECTLIGGEAYLRPDWVEIIARLVHHGVRVGVQTGGLALTDRRLDAAVSAGLHTLGVSVDGLEATHDQLRGRVGSYQAALSAIRRAAARGVATGCNTTITALNLHELEAMLDPLAEAGLRFWRFALAVPMGRAADNPELLVQPDTLSTLMPRLSALHHAARLRGVQVQLGNDLGYFGPHEEQLRGDDREIIQWTGCGAGRTGMGIEADGTIKACPSLATDTFSAGRFPSINMEDAWTHHPALSFTRRRTAADLSGFCRSCYYADVCHAGCAWMAHSLFGAVADNPYCHHRVLELARQGLRERVERVEAPAGRPFDVGRFRLHVTRIDGAPYEGPAPSDGTVARDVSTARAEHVSGRALKICRDCQRHVFAGTPTCPHCSADVAEAEARHQAGLAAYAQLEAVLRTMGR